MSNMQSYEALEADYSTDNFRRSEPIKAGKQSAPTRGRRRKGSNFSERHSSSSSSKNQLVVVSRHISHHVL